MRHAFATRLAIDGVDRRTLIEIGGWADSSVLDEVYAHTTDAHKESVISRSQVGPTKKPDERDDTNDEDPK
jgi:site-specific recombinase XerD